MHPRTMAILAVTASLVFLAIAVTYFAVQASALPGFFPGHAASTASVAERHHHHVKHGIAAAVVALGLIAFAWFRSAPDERSPDSAG